MTFCNVLSQINILNDLWENIIGGWHWSFCTSEVWDSMLQLLGRSVLLLSLLWGPNSLFIQVKNKIPIVWDGTKLDLRLGVNVAGSIRRYAVLSTQATLLKQRWFQDKFYWTEISTVPEMLSFTNNWTLVLPVLGDGNCCYLWLYSVLHLLELYQRFYVIVQLTEQPKRIQILKRSLYQSCRK